MNLVVGNTSQLFPYFMEYDPKIMGVSSRNFNYNEVKDYQFDKVFLVFAEQRIYLNESVDFFCKVNVDYTLDIINQLKQNTKTIVIYLTSDMWDLCEGGVTLETPFKNRRTSYVISKEILKEKVEELRVKENLDIRMIYPFNFNSPYRRPDFVFYKFLDVIINKNKIEVGDLNFERDIIHPKIVVDRSFNCLGDEIVGSGVLTRVKTFYSSILNHFGYDYDKYVTEKFDNFPNTRKTFYYENENKYLNLLDDTIRDIENYKNKLK